MSRNEYIAEFDELHLLASSLLSMDAEQAVTTVEELLIHAYLMGRRHACDDLDLDEGDIAYFLSLMEERENAQRMADTIYHRFDGRDFADRIREYLQTGDEAGLRRVIETEYHRDYNAGTDDLGKDYSDHTGRELRKQWNTMEDDRVRDTHDPLDKVIVRANEEFWTFDDDHAPYPGYFTKVENNANCRCWVTLIKS